MPRDDMETNASGRIGKSIPIPTSLGGYDRKTVETVCRAIERRELMLAFQPVVQAFENGRIAFYEGLARVMDETGRVIPARDFIEPVEPTEAGRVLDCLSLEMGLVALAEAPDLRLSINMSARSIGYPDWVATLKEGLERDTTAAERLILEITETSAMVMPDLVSTFIKDMQAKGIAFALDDFGSGQTSMSYLREFRFDILKIDGKFITGIEHDADMQVLTEAMIAIARHFDMYTVAENVETASDAAWLTKAGIDCMQGYAFGAPSLVPPWREGGEKRLA
ncbi:Putative cyclic di-GMP phosphodiesterase, EAL domain protein [Rhodovulum sp. P5]|uniref:EAL domain-containing protein n=1 Tax=Rhodovulum sp. P5 TaxID=1564506 RepID=UPI0009C32117|nr:EAL domain-containing protein [Rhodovulum sp. P5]ARE41271.1 Putative cyclic di-GMP phosphodiesterase, EAL domain protein [Rhodovulum sp. P5]